MQIYYGRRTGGPRLFFSDPTLVVIALATIFVDERPVLKRNEYQICRPANGDQTNNGRLTSGILLAVSIPEAEEKLINRRSGVVGDRMMRAIIDAFSDRQSKSGSAGFHSISSVRSALSTLDSLLISYLKEPKAGEEKTRIHFESGLKLKSYVEAMSHSKDTTATSQDMRQKTGLGPGRLRQLSRDLYGLPLNNLLFITGMQKAFELLLAGTESIEAIARRCGYSGRQNFITSFRRRYDITPEKLRLNLKLEGRR